jgi:hypothetical protein
MKAYKYKFLLWQLIAALDTGKHDALDIDDVKRHARAGTISAFLIDCFGSDADFSIFDPADWAAISEEWYSIDNAVNARRKFGVEKKGMALLMAYALESFQSANREEAGGV